jgi:hypothetical protein
MLHFPNKQAFSSFGRALERWKAGAPAVAEMVVRARCDVRSNSDPPSWGHAVVLIILSYLWMHINHLLDHRDVVTSRSVSRRLCCHSNNVVRSAVILLQHRLFYQQQKLLQATMEALPETISATHANSCAILQLLEGNQEESAALFHRALNDARDIIRYLGGFGGAPVSKSSLGSTYDAVVCSISLEGVIYQRNPSVQCTVCARHLR